MPSTSNIDDHSPDGWQAIELGDDLDEALAKVARLLAVLKRIAEEPDGPWKTTLAWQAYKREVPDAQ